MRAGACVYAWVGVHAHVSANVCALGVLACVRAYVLVCVWVGVFVDVYVWACASVLVPSALECVV